MDEGSAAADEDAGTTPHMEAAEDPGATPQMDENEDNGMETSLEHYVLSKT